jgi:hypothetical protein
MKYTDEFLINELHRWVKDNGKVPTTDAWDASSGYPSRLTYQRRFGSWGTVLTMGGYPENRRGLKPGQRPAIHGSGFVDDREPLCRDGERGSVEMQRWKEQVIIRDGCCSICGSTDKLIAHHVLGYAEYPMFRMELMNGYTVCPDCHKTIHYGELDPEHFEELTLLKIKLLNNLLSHKIRETS